MKKILYGNNDRQQDSKTVNINMRAIQALNINMI